MDCYICNPVCDNCKPKFIECPSCHVRTFLDLDHCPGCGFKITDDMRAEALEKWKVAHSGTKEQDQTSVTISTHPATPGK